MSFEDENRKRYCRGAQSEMTKSPALARLLACSAPAPPQWRPIETAPKDFTRSLFVAASGRMRVDGYHKDQRRDGHAPDDYPRWQELPGDRYTHWMPLPEGPK